MGKERLKRRNVLRQVFLSGLQHQNIAGANHMGAAKQSVRVVKAVAAMRGLVPALLVVRADSKIGVGGKVESAHALARCSSASTATT